MADFNKIDSLTVVQILEVIKYNQESFNAISV